MSSKQGPNVLFCMTNGANCTAWVSLNSMVLHTGAGVICLILPLGTAAGTHHTTHQKRGAGWFVLTSLNSPRVLHQHIDLNFCWFLPMQSDTGNAPCILPMQSTSSPGMHICRYLLLIVCIVDVDGGKLSLLGNLLKALLQDLAHQLLRCWLQLEHGMEMCTSDRCRDSWDMSITDPGALNPR
jgi:hypothetical protein